MAGLSRAPVSVRGCEISVGSAGQGEDILFLRGFDVLFDTSDFMAELAKNHRVIVPDHPGFGASALGDRGASVSDLSWFYLDLLDELGLASAHVVGASIGGWIGAEMALRTDGRLRSLTLISPAGIRKKGAAIGDPFIRSPAAAAELILAEGYEGEAYRAAETDEEMDAYLKNSMALARISWHPRLSNPALPRWLHRIKVPSHLIWGGADRIFPPEHSSVWQEGIPNLSFNVVEGAGHLPHVERPQAVAAEIDQFLRSLKK